MKVMDIGTWLYHRADVMINLAHMQNADDRAVSLAVASELRDLWDTIRVQAATEKNFPLTFAGIREQHNRWLLCDVPVTDCDDCPNSTWCEVPVGHCEQIDFLLAHIDALERAVPADLQAIVARQTEREENERAINARGEHAPWMTITDVRTLLGHINAMKLEERRLLERIASLEAELRDIEMTLEERERAQRERLHATILEVVGEQKQGVGSSKELLDLVRAKGVSTDASKVLGAIWSMVDTGRLVMNRDCILVLPNPKTSETP